MSNVAPFLHVYLDEKTEYDKKLQASYVEVKIIFININTSLIFQLHHTSSMHAPFNLFGSKVLL